MGRGGVGESEIPKGQLLVLVVGRDGRDLLEVSHDLILRRDRNVEGLTLQTGLDLKKPRSEQIRTTWNGAVMVATLRISNE